MAIFPFSQGHGLQGRYGGLEEEWSDFSRSKIVIQPVAFDLTTTYGHGTNLGPAALIEASRHLELYDIETDSQVCLKGICTLETLEPKTSKEMRDSLYRQTRDLIRQEKFIATIGGEHSISWAPIKAHSEIHPSLSVLQLDAHADLQEAYEGDPWSHACVMSRVIELPGVQNIISVGVRSMSQEEKKIFH